MVRIGAVARRSGWKLAVLAVFLRSSCLGGRLSAVATRTDVIGGEFLVLICGETIGSVLTDGTVLLTVGMTVLVLSSVTVRGVSVGWDCGDTGR
jgi:hypothetical protein